MPYRLNRGALTCAAAAVLVTFGTGHGPATGQLNTINMPVYDDAIMSCVDPEIIQARVVVDVLSDQLVDAELQLAMHAANRAEALRRAGTDQGYIEQMDAAIAEDRSRLSFLTENLTCWRARLNDLIAGRDPDEKPGDQVTTEDDPFSVDPTEVEELDRTIARLIEAANEFEETMRELERSLADAGYSNNLGGGVAPDVSIGPPGSETPDRDAATQDDQAAIQAREAAADRLLTGPLWGALVDSEGRSIPVPIHDK